MTNSTDAELRARLTPEQYKVTQKAGTERAFSGDYWDTKIPGVYRCVVCELDLFASDDKYDSGTGWPSFTSEISDGRVSLHSDRKFLIKRTEVRCASCDSHLGHVFGDGPRDAGGQRYCLNSAALILDEDDTEQQVAS
jgi:peptide-methionine (R)-S-oxide reductase